MSGAEHLRGVESNWNLAALRTLAHRPQLVCARFENQHRLHEQRHVSVAVGIEIVLPALGPAAAVTPLIRTAQTFSCCQPASSQRTMPASFVSKSVTASPRRSTAGGSRGPEAGTPRRARPLRAPRSTRPPQFGIARFPSQ